MRQDKFLRFLFGLSLISLLVLTACQKSKEPEGLKEGSSVTALTLKSVDNTHNWNISSETAPVIIINFWATWCPSCREEMPSMQKFYKSFNNKGVRLITVLYRDDPYQALEYMNQMHYDFPVMIDPEHRGARLFGITGVPETYIINRERVLLNRIIGPFDWDSPDFRQYISELIK